MYFYQTFFDFNLQHLELMLSAGAIIEAPSPLSEQ
jgi:hypothetical protein